MFTELSIVMSFTSRFIAKNINILYAQNSRYRHISFVSWRV
jgi:hypothetical protein